MELDLRLGKEEKRGEKGLRQREREKVWAGIVLLHQVAGVRAAVWYLRKGGGGRSARGDWRGLKRGVAEVDEARYG